MSIRAKHNANLCSPQEFRLAMLFRYLQQMFASQRATSACAQPQKIDRGRDTPRDLIATHILVRQIRVHNQVSSLIPRGEESVFLRAFPAGFLS